jgi:ABC-type multidrug transport system fused ATPase/permease subunit
MKKILNYSFWDYIADLWHYIKPYKNRFFIGVVLRLTSDISRLYPAIATSQIISLLSGTPTGEDLKKIYLILPVLGFLVSYYAITHSLSKFFGYRVAEKAGLDIFKDSLTHIYSLDFAWQEKENSGNKMRRIEKGADGVVVSIRRIFDVLIEVMVNIVGVIVIFGTTEKLLSFALMFFIVSYYIVGTYLLKRAVKQERIVNKEFENLGGLTFESLNNIQTIKSLAIDRGVIFLIKRKINLLVKKIYKRVFYFQTRSATLNLYEYLFWFLIISILVRGVINGIYDISLLVLFIGLFYRVSSSARELTEVTEQIALAKIWISRAKAILETESVIENPDKLTGQIKYFPDWKKLKIVNVNFSYRKNEALHNVTFDVSRGEKVGIVGLSGAGKSTLFKLILDLYEDYKGDIYLDNIPLKKMHRQSYIDHVAVVLQDTELFDMTLSDNIRIAANRRSKNDERLIKVIEMAHLNDVVEKLPHGVDTVVGEKGIRLSGGQRQRVGIARALYRQPDILLLDEATSHLDAHSEKEIQKALEENMSKFTTIVIAHRLSTIKAMDKIIVLENGKVAETGGFEELLQKGGVFSKMWSEQKI